MEQNTKSYAWVSFEVCPVKRHTTSSDPSLISTGVTSLNNLWAITFLSRMNDIDFWRNLDINLCLDMQGEPYYKFQSLCVSVMKCYVLLNGHLLI